LPVVLVPVQSFPDGRCEAGGEPYIGFVLGPADVLVQFGDDLLVGDGLAPDEEITGLGIDETPPGIRAPDSESPSTKWITGNLSGMFGQGRSAAQVRLLRGLPTVS
jgi:hypothetical protein